MGNWSKTAKYAEILVHGHFESKRKLAEKRNSHTRAHDNMGQKSI